MLRDVVIFRVRAGTLIADRWTDYLFRGDLATRLRSHLLTMSGGGARIRSQPRIEEDRGMRNTSGMVEGERRSPK